MCFICFICFICFSCLICFNICWQRSKKGFTLHALICKDQQMKHTQQMKHLLEVSDLFHLLKMFHLLVKKVSFVEVSFIGFPPLSLLLPMIVQSRWPCRPVPPRGVTDVRAKFVAQVQHEIPEEVQEEVVVKVPGKVERREVVVAAGPYPFLQRRRRELERRHPLFVMHDTSLVSPRPLVTPTVSLWRHTER